MQNIFLSASVSLWLSPFFANLRYMNRRRFIAGAASSTIDLGLRRLAQATQNELLVPSDVADEFGFRIMWYVPVRPIDPATYRLKISGLLEKPQSFTLEQLRRFPQETQTLSHEVRAMLVISSQMGRLPFRPSDGDGETSERGQSGPYRLC